METPPNFFLPIHSETGKRVILRRLSGGEARFFCFYKIAATPGVL